VSAHALGVIELRQYLLQPGVRDQFVALFDSELAHTQEAVGISVLGQFRDLDRPDAFVWMRGFPDMDSRAAALHEFYYGPVWARHRDVANPMMRDSDDVLLLEPVDLGPLAGANNTWVGVLYVEICNLEPGATYHYLDQYNRQVAPALRAAGAQPLAALRTLHAVNTFPRLPVREDVNVAVTLTSFPSASHAESALGQPELAAAAAAVATEVGAAPLRLRLTPTPGSALTERRNDDLIA
jgi:hypothetical protein